MNTARISLTSFLAYFIMSAVITPIGIVSQPIADHFAIDLTAATALFSYLTTGIFIGSIIALFVFDWLKIKSVVFSSAALILTSLLLLYPAANLVWLSLCLLVVGIGCGVALSAAAVVLTEAWSERYRPSALLLTDSFYSGAGSLTPIIGVALLAMGWYWWSVYLLAVAAIVLLMSLALFSHYPQRVKPQASSDSSWAWPLSVYVCGLALLFYLLGVVTLYSWLPNYAQTVLGIETIAAGNLVGRFFFGMLCGQLVMFVLVLLLPVRLLILIAVVGASVLTFGLWYNTTLLSISALVFMLGFAGGGIFKVLVAYGTTLLATPSPKMVSYLLFNTALGTAIAPALSAKFVAAGSISTAMQFTSLCYVLTAILVMVTFVLASHSRSSAIH